MSEQIEAMRTDVKAIRWMSLKYRAGLFLLGGNVGAAWYGAVLGRWPGVVAALIGAAGAWLLMWSVRQEMKARAVRVDSL